MVDTGLPNMKNSLQSHSTNRWDQVISVCMVGSEPFYFQLSTFFIVVITPYYSELA